MHRPSQGRRERAVSANGKEGMGDICDKGFQLCVCGPGIKCGRGAV